MIVWARIWLTKRPCVNDNTTLGHPLRVDGTASTPNLVPRGIAGRLMTLIVLHLISGRHGARANRHHICVDYLRPHEEEDYSIQHPCRCALLKWIREHIHRARMADWVLAGPVNRSPKFPRTEARMATRKRYACIARSKDSGRSVSSAQSPGGVPALWIEPWHGQRILEYRLQIPAR